MQQSGSHLKLAKGEETKEDEDLRFLNTTICNIVELFEKDCQFFTDKKILKQQFLPPRVDMEISRKKLYY